MATSRDDETCLLCFGGFAIFVYYAASVTTLALSPHVLDALDQARPFGTVERRVNSTVAEWVRTNAHCFANDTLPPTELWLFETSIIIEDI